MSTHSSIDAGRRTCLNGTSNGVWHLYRNPFASILQGERAKALLARRQANADLMLIASPEENG
jgi:hypothetical protein